MNLELASDNSRDALVQNVNQTIDFNEAILNPAENTNQLTQQAEEAINSKASDDIQLADNARLVETQGQVQDAEGSNELGNNLLVSLASDNQITSFNTILNTLSDFPKDNMQVFSENSSLKADADINQLFKEITDYFNEHPDIPKETLNDIIKEPLYKGLLKNIISNSFAMEPKDVTKPGELSKLYEKVLKQTEALERMVANINNKAADTIKNQANEIKQNINFMNSASEMYNFVQIPLKMYNQNTDSMLYVKQNKKSSYEAGEEITAFLHFDMEYLGSTDVFISLKEANVACKWNLANEDSMNLIEENLDLLTQRLEEKGFSVTSELVCGNPKTSFVEDFLGEQAPSTENTSEGLVHRYSFDMRA